MSDSTQIVLILQAVLGVVIASALSVYFLTLEYQATAGFGRRGGSRIAASATNPSATTPKRTGPQAAPAPIPAPQPSPPRGRPIAIPHANGFIVTAPPHTAPTIIGAPATAQVVGIAAGGTNGIRTPLPPPSPTPLPPQPPPPALAATNAAIAIVDGDTRIEVPDPLQPQQPQPPQPQPLPLTIAIPGTGAAAGAGAAPNGTLPRSTSNAVASSSLGGGSASLTNADRLPFWWSKCGLVASLFYVPLAVDIDGALGIYHYTVFTVLAHIVQAIMFGAAGFWIYFQSQTVYRHMNRRAAGELAPLKRVLIGIPLVYGLAMTVFEVSLLFDPTRLWDLLIGVLISSTLFMYGIIMTTIYLYLNRLYRTFVATVTARPLDRASRLFDISHLNATMRVFRFITIIADVLCFGGGINFARFIPTDRFRDSLPSDWAAQKARPANLIGTSILCWGVLIMIGVLAWFVRRASDASNAYRSVHAALSPVTYPTDRLGTAAGDDAGTVAVDQPLKPNNRTNGVQTNGAHTNGNGNGNGNGTQPPSAYLAAGAPPGFVITADNLGGGGSPPNGDEPEMSAATTAAGTQMVSVPVHSGIGVGVMYGGYHLQLPGGGGAPAPLSVGGGDAPPPPPSGRSPVSAAAGMVGPGAGGNRLQLPGGSDDRYAFKSVSRGIASPLPSTPATGTTPTHRAAAPVSDAGPLPPLALTDTLPPGVPPTVATPMTIVTPVITPVAVLPAKVGLPPSTGGGIINSSSADASSYRFSGGSGDGNGGGGPHHVKHGSGGSGGGAAASTSRADRDTDRGIGSGRLLMLSASQLHTVNQTPPTLPAPVSDVIMLAVAGGDGATTASASSGGGVSAPPTGATTTATLTATTTPAPTTHTTQH